MRLFKEIVLYLYHLHHQYFLSCIKTIKIHQITSLRSDTMENITIYVEEIQHNVTSQNSLKEADHI